MSMELSIILSMVIPAVGGVLIALTGKIPNLRESVTLITAVALFLNVLSLLGPVMDGATPEVTLIEMFPGLEIAFKVEPLGMMFSLIASGLWILNSIYSIGYMRGNKEKHQTRFYICFAVAISATLGLAYSANLLTLFIFYEVLTFSTYPLVSHKGDENAVKGARTYLGILVTTSVAFLFLAIAWTYAATGTLDFVSGGILGGKVEGVMMGLLLMLFIYGIGKAAVMPVHRWLPAAMVAPTPVSALLHAVAVVKSGVFSVVKVIVYTFGIDNLVDSGSTDWLVWISGFTIIAASMVALRQDNLKRRLAYSTISQLSYVVLAAAILTPISAVGAALHIAAHAFGKITLFFAAGSIYTAAHKTEVSQLDGIGWKMPITMTAFAIGALSMIGLPPTAGFISKWYIVQGAMSSENFLALSVVVLSTLLNAGYFLPIIYKAFFKTASASGDHHHDDHGEAPLPIVIAITSTALLTILMFFFPDVALNLAQQMIGGAQ
ncbi:monovalent cation/H+ antiporter subunit D family protein [Terasakiella sp. A23]|uniref:monovalent cation/H+ antiporter subunit D family protein n=1 Tax=Terasakiella sp. FCG-A23 TaxID=3080561 RepID=UPI002953C73C|nr:monovalent cation/H+ antiporter subunit D family protein [Terasakiella sp. A23]MDV7338794.1 monovalent cation/H+ antiporter subunit D family protein [Terasakiella sp. A23]